MKSKSFIFSVLVGFILVTGYLFYPLIYSGELGLPLSDVLFKISDSLFLVSILLALVYSICPAFIIFLGNLIWDFKFFPYSLLGTFIGSLIAVYTFIILGYWSLSKLQF